MGLGCYLVQTRAFSFIKPKIVEFPTISNCCFSFPEASCWAPLASFSKLSFGEISLWTVTEVWLLLVPLRAAFLAEMSARLFPLASRESSLECSGI